MKTLDALLTLICPDNLDEEAEIKSWRVFSTKMDDSYMEEYEIITIDDETIEITVQAKKTNR